MIYIHYYPPLFLYLALTDIKTDGLCGITVKTTELNGITQSQYLLVTITEFGEKPNELTFRDNGAKKDNPKDTCYDCTLTIGKLTFGYTNWSF